MMKITSHKGARLDIYGELFSDYSK